MIAASGPLKSPQHPLPIPSASRRGVRCDNYDQARAQNESMGTRNRPHVGVPRPSVDRRVPAAGASPRCPVARRPGSSSWPSPSRSSASSDRASDLVPAGAAPRDPPVGPKSPRHGRCRRSGRPATGPSGSGSLSMQLRRAGRHVVVDLGARRRHRPVGGGVRHRLRYARHRRPQRPLKTCSAASSTAVFLLLDAGDIPSADAISKLLPLLDDDRVP